MVKIVIDTQNCIGCAACVSLCEEVFEMKDGKAVVKKQDPKKPCVKEAIEGCPVQVISLK